MTNPPVKSSLPTIVAQSLPSSKTSGSVITNFSIATSQLLELVTDCNEKNVDILERITSLEKAVTTLAHPPIPPPVHYPVTTADLGKAMSTVEERMLKEIIELKKQITSLHEDIHTLQQSKKESDTVLSSTTDKADSFRTSMQVGISTLVKALIEALRNLDGQVGFIRTTVNGKKE